jgi:hypothetical protein
VSAASRWQPKGTITGTPFEMVEDTPENIDRIIDDPMTGEPLEIPITKEEIVKASIPDYYALRRNEYPKLSDQLDAIWKGQDSEAFLNMKNKILEVKTKYPK